MNFVWKKARFGAIALFLICLASVLGSCSSSKEPEETNADEAVVAQEASNYAAAYNVDSLAQEEAEHTVDATTESVMPATGTAASATTVESMTTTTKIQTNSEYRNEDDSLVTDLSSLNLKANSDDEQAIIQVVRAVYPSFNPLAYEFSQTPRDDDNSFWVEFRLKVGDYTTTKGYEVRFKDNQAIEIYERGVSLSIPSVAIIAKFPAVTEQIIQAAYQQGKEEVYTRNPNYVVREQSGYAFYKLATNECFYNVRSVYTTSATSPAKGVVDTKYIIPLN